MIRVTITTSSSWAPQAHGSSHGTPHYRRNIQRAKVSSTLGDLLPEMFAMDYRELGLVPDIDPEHIRVRYAEISAADIHAPDIELEISVAKEVAVEYGSAYKDRIISMIDAFIAQHCPDDTPSLLIHVISAQTYGFRRSADGSMHEWKFGKLRKA